MNTPLIQREDILEQATYENALLQAWAPIEGCLNSLSSERAVLLVGEGSSYNAAAWMLPTLRQHFPQRRFMLRYPWELHQELQHNREETAKTLLPHPYIIALSQSGRTASLLEAMAKLRQRLPKAEGLLISNAPIKMLATDAWAPLTPLCLGLGEETGIAATKTFSATALTLLALACPKTAKGLLTQISHALPTFFKDLEAQTQWQATLAQCIATQENPMVIVGHAGIMPLLGEAHLKITETLSRPVLCYHHEGFKHGPRSVLHRAKAQWPQLIYSVPTDLNAATDVFLDASVHLGHLNPQDAGPLRHLWLGTLGTAKPPQSLLALGESVYLPLPKGLPDDWTLLFTVQWLCLHLVEAGNLQTDGLTKFIAE